MEEWRLVCGKERLTLEVDLFQLRWLAELAEGPHLASHLPRKKITHLLCDIPPKKHSGSTFLNLKMVCLNLQMIRLNHHKQ